MTTTGYGSAVTLDRPFQEVVADVRRVLKDQGFGVLSEIDVQATLQEKLGESMPPYLILGACNPPLAHRALQADASIGLLLPCNVVVREAGGRTVVEALDPQVMVQLTGEAALAPVADEAARRLVAALEALAAAD
jgi:uncharacterized protein (DUF302 family)